MQPIYRVIRACINVFGKEMPQVVVFDNAFHLTMPEEAYMFAVPYEYYEKYKIRRYGFHGTSHRYVSGVCTELLGGAEGTKIISCHIGNGSSITAIKDGKVIDTSMGLTPLDGFMMGTRTGTLDPSVVCYIQEKEGLTGNQMSELFNKKSVCSVFPVYPVTTGITVERCVRATRGLFSPARCSSIR